MDKYQPKDFEEKWYKRWEQDNNFAPSGVGTPYSIAIPPPNVTGTLHMGHAFQHSLVDSLIRYRRMKGHNTLWQMGTDHAGIATQLIVTEQLAAENITPTELGREKFVQKIWDWKRTSGNTISKQLRRMGASLHWETERFTLDEGLSRAVHEVFVRLYEEGLIYRGKRLVNWDPVLKTSISDLEVVAKEEEGHLWHLRYPLAEDPKKYIVVATTRPETMLGDTAVAVHPEDERYKSLVGQAIMLPLSQRTIPIISDEYVDQDFGSGCVKITPAHDFNDYDMGTRHDLKVINVFNEDASVNEQAPKKYHGMDRYEARNAILRDLEELDMIEKIEAHTLSVPRGERSGVIIEPYLSDQWFVKTRPLAEPATEKVKSGEIEFIPKNYENTFFAWMKDIQDWCISRQQWWGHRIPAWYDEEGKIYVGRDEREVRAKNKLPNDFSLKQDEDVLDTWFSSALWTFSTLGWPDRTEDLKTFHPTSVMVTGHDIISFWVSRMIMMTLKFVGEVPFKKVYVTGMVTDADGQKQSKSKGNGLDPMDIIEGISLEDLIHKRTANLLQPRMAKSVAQNTSREFPKGIQAFGTDALRFTFYSIATRSRAIRFDMNRVEGYQHFCNKLWNAANFVFINTNEEELGRSTSNCDVIDSWIVSELNHTVELVTEAMNNFRFDLAAKAIYEFVWDEFCDWYLELVKPILNQPGLSEQDIQAKRFTLISVLEQTLRLSHPFLPFITEEIWQKIPRKIRGEGKTIMNRPYPLPDQVLINQSANSDVAWVKEVVTGTRNIRGEMDISFSTPIPIIFSNGSKADKDRFHKFRSVLDYLIKPKEISWAGLEDDHPPSSTHLVGEMQLLVPLRGLINKEKEISRLNKEINRKTVDQARAEKKLNNKEFLRKAPSEVVNKEQEKLNDIKSALFKLQEQKLKISSL